MQQKGVLLIWIMVGQGLTVLVVGADGGCLDFFSFTLKCAVISLFFHPLSWFGWLVGCFGLNGPFSQYFSLYRAVSQRRRKKREMREKMSKQPPPAPIASTIGPCLTIIQISRTPRHWKFTQHLRTTDHPIPLSWMAGWMTWDFTSISAKFHLY